MKIDKEILKKRFALNSDCFLITGVRRGAIYDLSTGDIYSINEDSSKFLDKCEKGISVGRIMAEMPKIALEAIAYLKNLKLLKLGKFIDEDCQFPGKISLAPQRQKIDFIWLELIHNCNLRCLHCYANSNSKGNQPITNNLLTLCEWKRIIKEFFDKDCKKLQFIGGEPMLFGKNIYILIELASSLGYELIEVFTNATLISKEDVDMLAKYNVQIATSIYSKRTMVHDRITGKRGSFDKTVETIKRIQDKGLKIRFATVIMKQNEEYAEETASFLKELGNGKSRISSDIARPIGRASSQNLLSDSLTSKRLTDKAIFAKITKDEFITRKNGNGCWQDKLCITPNGQVIPCIMARKEIIGNVKTQSFNDILSGEQSQFYWKLSKDRIDVCRDCEYRYACSDCRPLVKGQTENLFAKPPDCLYDPYLGQWNTV